MKKKVYLSAALTALALVSCTDESLIDSSVPKGPEQPKENTAILFGAGANKLTRADKLTGKEAAEKLNQKFVVYGYKGTFDLPAANKELAFPNYVVKYEEGTAHTTQTNVADWEYVGYTNEPLTGDVATQIIKYWDYSAPYYNFMAWSIDPASSAIVKEIIKDDADADNGDKIIFSVPSAKDAASVYFSNRYTATPDGKVTASTGNYDIQKVDNRYQETVTLTFRNLGAKVRLGIYETIPGYTVNDVVFYEAGTQAGYPQNQRVKTVETGDYPRVRTQNTYAGTTVAGSATVNGDYKQEVLTYGECSACLFAKNGQSPFALSGDFEITYGATDNVAKIKQLDAAGSATASSFTFGERSRADVLGETSNTATFWGKEEANYYTFVMPMEGNQQNLYLKVDYTLTAQDGSGETIRVQGATAVVPFQYAQWKANYAYTYLFKISDKTNGFTGGDTPGTPDDPEEDNPTDPNPDDPENPNPAGLYPITFDACVVNTEDGYQETITTVATPSITTYQFGSEVVTNNEYLSDKGDIYVNVMIPKLDKSGYKPAELTIGTNIWLYTAEKLGNEPITEGSVANPVSQIALTESDLLQACVNGTDVPTVDGYTFNGGNYFVKFTPTAGTVYVVKYKVADGEYAYKVIKIDGTAATYTYVLGDLSAASAALNEAVTVAVTNNGKAVTAAATALRIKDENGNDVTSKFKVEETATGTYSITPKRCVTGKDYTVNFGNAEPKDLTVSGLSMVVDATDNTIIATESTTITIKNKAEGEGIEKAALTLDRKEGVKITEVGNGDYTFETTNKAAGEYVVSYLGQSVTIKVNNYELKFEDLYVNNGKETVLRVKCNGENNSSAVTLTLTNASVPTKDITGSGPKIKAQGVSGDKLVATLGNAEASIIIKDFKVADYTPAATDPIAGTLATDEKFVQLTEGGAPYNAEAGTLTATDNSSDVILTSVKGVYRVKSSATLTLTYKGVKMF